MVQALYRQYRSATFDALIGQGHVGTTLKNQLKGGHVAHAYLFTGIRGTGKTSAARILARAVNCENASEGEPCNACASCTAILEGNALDVVEIDAASNRGIDEMRNLRERVHFLPALLSRKVYIIDEAHMLTTEAWNAFLKTLEEPPAHVLFILATTEPQRIPETVRSRVQRFDFRRLTRAELEDHVRRIALDEKLDLDEGAVTQIARSARGSARDALSLLEYVAAFRERGTRVTGDDVRESLGLADPQRVADLLSALVRGEGSMFLSQLEEFFQSGVDPRQLVHQLEEVAKDAAVTCLGGHADNTLLPSLDGVPVASWLAIVEALSSKEAALRHSIDPRLDLELVLLQLLSGFGASGGQPSAVTREEGRKETRNTERDAAPVMRIVPEAGEERPADAKAAATVPGAGDVWASALDQAQKVDPMLSGILRSCTFGGAQGSTATILAPFSFHYERLTTAERRAQLASVFASVDPLITEVTVKYEPAEERGPSTEPSADEATREVIALFPGSQIVASRLRDPSDEGSGGRRTIQQGDPE